MYQTLGQNMDYNGSNSLYAQYKKEREDIETIELDAGFIQYRIVGEECYITDIYVLPEMRQSHIGTRLADQVEAKAREAGCVVMTGTVVPSLKGATESLAAQLHYGFRVHSAREDLIILVKDIRDTEGA